MDEKRIANFIASGLSDTQIAGIVGCTPAYLCQLKKEDSFSTLVVAAIAELPKECAEEERLGLKYLAVEHKVLRHLEDRLAFAEFRDAVAALRVLGDRQEKREARRHPAMASPGHITNNYVQLSIPSHALPELTFNAQMEVVAIGDKGLAPLSSVGVKDLFSSLKGVPPTASSILAIPSIAAIAANAANNRVLEGELVDLPALYG